MAILDRFRIDDRVAIVTGASSGLGVAFAAALADVSLGARREDRLEATRKLVEDAGRRAITVRTDVASPDDCDQLVDATTRAFGKVDILVNNAERLRVSRITFSGECAPSATDRYSGSG
jgi:NADP-dependent 3-hydroxy acid dehydrogenase YdfG